MNTSGKNLEQHEILKVKLLRCLDGDIDKYMVLWNKISDVDTLFSILHLLYHKSNQYYTSILHTHQDPTSY